VTGTPAIATPKRTGPRRALILVGCVVVLVAGVVSARAASVTTAEDSIALEPGDVRAVHARPLWGLPLRDTMSWSIVPSWLGAMDERGGFHAGNVTGSGTLTARFGSSSAAIAVTVTCPKTADIQDVHFEVSCGRAADVYVDVRAVGGAERMREEVEREADRVSGDLQFRSDGRLRVYYVGSTAAFGTAVSWLGRGFATPTVRESDAAYLDLEDVIAIDQSQTSVTQTAQAVRHELVHHFVRQLVGYANVAKIPTWLNEGLAFLEESDPGWQRTEARIVSASSAHLGRLPSLAMLSDLGAWNDRTGLDHLYQYYAAAQAAQFLVDDLTIPGLLRVLNMVGTGTSFAKALAQAVPDFDYNAFASRLSDRVTALVPTYPGIAVAAGSPDGTGITVIAYGLTPNAPATIATKGPLERLAAGRVDPYGIYVKYLGAEWPVGEYRVTLETEGRRFEVTATR
jgi:hypothetical protein